jgi:hypothetical protein
MRYELSDYEWAAIKPMLPNKPRGVPRENDRRVLNGIFWVLRSGAPWRDLKETYGPRTTCYNRFVRWRRGSVPLDQRRQIIRLPESQSEPMNHGRRSPASAFFNSLLGCAGPYSMKSATVVTFNRNVGRTFSITGMYSFHSSEECCSDRPRNWLLEWARSWKNR